MITSLVLASRNEKKLKELNAIISSLGIKAVLLSDISDAPSPEETGLTFAENARIKAIAAFRDTSRPSVSDDSGLEVEALEGRPGVLSARFGGDGLDDAGRTALLLETMRDIPPGKRAARFTSAICCVINDQIIIETQGHLYGEIALSPAGAFGFGYDPVFFLPQYNKTLAEISEDLKNEISHRAEALGLFCQRLKDIN